MHTRLSNEMTTAQKTIYFDMAQTLLAKVQRTLTINEFNQSNLKLEDMLDLNASADEETIVAIREFIDVWNIGFNEKATIAQRDKAICFRLQLAKVIVDDHSKRYVSDGIVWRLGEFLKPSLPPSFTHQLMLYQSCGIDLIGAYLERHPEINDVDVSCAQLADINDFEKLFKANSTVRGVGNNYANDAYTAIASLSKQNGFNSFEQSNALANVLSENRTIRKIRIGEYERFNDIKIIMDAVVKYGVVEELAFSNLRFSVDLSRYLMSVLTVNTSKIKSIAFIECEYPVITYSSLYVSDLLQDAIFKSKTIERLSFENTLPMACMSVLLRMNNTLKELKIVSNCRAQGDYRVSEFIQCLAANTSLHKLSLCIHSHTINKANAVSLVNVFIKSNTLAELDLHGCDFEDDAYVELFKALASSRKLKKCRLSVGDLGAARKLSEALNDYRKEDLQHLLLQISFERKLMDEMDESDTEYESVSEDSDNDADEASIVPFLTGFNALYAENLRRLNHQSIARLFLPTQCGPEVAARLSIFAGSKRAREEGNAEDDPNYNDALATGCELRLKRPAVSYQ